MSICNKYKHIEPSKIVGMELTLALLSGVCPEIINTYAQFTLNPFSITHIRKMPSVPPTYKQFFRCENESYEAQLVSGQKVICEYIQTGIESGEIRSCILLGEKETPLPIPQDNFFILRSHFNQVNRNTNTQ